MSKRLIKSFIFDAAAGTVSFRGKFQLKSVLLITNVTSNVIIYNFSDPTKGGTTSFTSPRTTITLDYDTSAMSDSDDLQIFLDIEDTTITPVQPMQDAVERMRVSNPQALIDTDFEYSLQPTKWETLQTQNNIPSVYQKSNEPAFTADQIVSITTASLESTPTVGGITYDTSFESLFFNTGDVATGRGNDGVSTVTLGVNRGQSEITVVGSGSAGTGTTALVLPSGLAQNDVIFYYGAADGGVPNIPTGFTDITSINNQVDTRLAYLVIPATIPTQITGLSNSGDEVHGCVILRNVDTADVVNIFAVQSGNNQYANPPAITTDEAGCAILTFVGIDDDEFADEMVASVNFDLLMSANSGAGNRSSMNIAMYQQPTAGTINPGVQGYLDPTYVSSNITIPFSVTVLGTTFTNVNFNQAGVMFFNTAAGTNSTVNLTQPNYVNSPHLKIFAQAANATKIGVITTGTSPSRKRIIKYEITTDTAGAFDYSNVVYIVFTEGSNDIELHYYKNANTGTAQLSDGTDQINTWVPTANSTPGTFNTGYITRDAFSFNLETAVRQLIRVEVDVAPIIPFAVGDPITIKETLDPIYLDTSSIIVQVGGGGTIFYIPNISPVNYVGDQSTDFTIIYTGGFYYTAEIPYTRVQSITGTRQIRITFSTPPSLFIGSTIFVVDSLSSDVDWIGAFVINKVLSSTEYEYLALRDTNYTSTTTLSGDATKIYTSNQGAAQHRYFDGGVQISPETTAPNANIIRQTRSYFRYQSGKSIQFSTGVLFKPTYDIATVSVNTNGYDPTALELADTGSYTLTIETEQVNGFGLPGDYREGAQIELTGFEVTTGANYNTTASVIQVNSPKTFQIEIPVTGSAPIIDLTPGGIKQVVVKKWNDATVRTGMFDDQNGLFLEHDGQDLYAVRRNSTQQLQGLNSIADNSTTLTGTNTNFKSQLSAGDYIVIKGTTYLVTDIASDTSLTIAPDYKGPAVTNTKIVRVTDLSTASQDFSIDPLDGTGPSGYVFDPNKMQMVFIDYSWYGAGKIRYGMRGLDGEIFYFHDYVNNNNNTEAYMRSGNLPGRFEISTKGINGKIQDVLTSSDPKVLIPTFNADMMPTSGSIVIKDEYIEYSKGTITGSNTFLNLDNRNVGFLTTIPASSPALTSFQTVNQNLAPVLSHWGVSVIMDGNFNEDKSYLFAAQNNTTKSIPAGEILPLLTIRLAPSVDYGIPSFFGVRNLINRSSIILRELQIVTDGYVTLECRINGNNVIYNVDANWLEVGNGSISQYVDHELDTGNNPTNDGDLVASFLTDEGINRLSATAFDISEVRNLGNSVLGGPNTFPDGPDVLVVSVKNLGVTPCNAACSISWIESQG